MPQYQKLDRFPLGSIRAEGFLREQLLRSRDGMGGHLDELEPGMIADPFVHKTYVKRWGDGDQSGWGAEISGNYWTGLIELAYTLGDEGLIKKATDWVDAMLKHQRPDGYLGTYYEPDAKIYEDYNAWGTSCAMRGLIAFYEATGRADVLEAVHRCMLWFRENWRERKTNYAAPLIIEILVFCYYYTKDERMIDFAVEYEDYLVKNDIFGISYKALLERGVGYNSNHTAGYGVALRLPALLYSVTGNGDYLAASEGAIADLMKKAVQLSGSPVSVNEYLGPVGGVNETEYCSYAFFNATYSYLSFVTGKAVYGDYMERMFYNGAQGARKKDERAIAYLSSPNQFYATDSSSAAMDDMQVYSPCYPVSCCPVNSVAVLPEFVRGMMLRDGGGNVYMTAYGPCSLDFGGIKITERTLYPFRDSAEFEICADKELTLYFRCPTWSDGLHASVNGETVRLAADDSGYAALRRVWRAGDVVRLDFRFRAEAVRVDDTDASGKHPIAFLYGPLLFSYHIPEDWREYPGTPETPLPEGWSWFRVNPHYEEAAVDDPHEQIGLRREQISWNLAVDGDIKPSDVSVELAEGGGYVWEKPPIKLHIPAYKAEYLCAPYPHRTFEPFGDTQPVDETRGAFDLALVPYGCTNLRLTYFPRKK